MPCLGALRRGNEAARVHYACRWRGGGVATRSACADQPSPWRLALPGERTARANGLFEAFSQGLKELGWIEGQNVSFEYRFAEGKGDALPRLAAELVQLRVDAILTKQHAVDLRGKKCHANHPYCHGGNSRSGRKRL